MKTGIFIDLDGTLLNDRKEISKGNLEAIKKIKNNKHFVVYLITGKSDANAIECYQKLNLKNKLITSGGQIISNPSKSKIYKKTHTSIHDLRNLFHLLDKKEIMGNFLIEKENSEYIVFKNKESYPSRIIAKNHKLHTYNSDINYTNIVGTYIQLQNVKSNDLDQLTKDINKKNKNLKVMYWLSKKGPFILQVIPSNINKGIAVEFIRKKDKLNKVISIGDGWIDVPMFQKSDYSFAMKNAVKKIKTFTNEVTESDNNDSGLGKALLKIIELYKSYK